MYQQKAVSGHWEDFLSRKMPAWVPWSKDGWATWALESIFVSPLPHHRRKKPKSSLVDTRLGWDAPRPHSGLMGLEVPMG